MRKFITSIPFRLAVLLWFSGWLLLVMPGHKRGIVTLPGSEAQQQEVASCCEPKPSCCDVLGEDKPAGPIDPAKHCAICFLKSHLTDPPPVALYTPYLGELDELDYVIHESIKQTLAAPTQMRGRAPPV